MSDKPLPSAGIGTGTTLTTTLIGILTSAAGFVPADYREVYANVIPFLSPALAWLMMRIYNGTVEPEDMAGVRKKLEGDLKRLTKIRKDTTLTPEQLKEFDDDYVDTQRRIARLGRDFSDGKYQKNETPAAS